MDVDIELHEPYQDDGDTTDEEGVGMEPGAYNEAANSDDDVLILFANIHSCITDANPSIGRFEVNPPSLEECLRN